MKKLIVMTTLVLAASSCGKKNSDPVAETTQVDIGKITNVEISQEDQEQYYMSVKSSARSFDVTVQVQENKGDDGKYIARAKHTQAQIGLGECLEYKNNQCQLQEFNFDFLDRGIRYQGKFKVAKQSERIAVRYFEQEVDSVGMNVGPRTEVPFAMAVYRKISFGAKEVHGFYLTDYTNRVGVRDQVFIKKMDHPDRHNVKIIVVGKLPRTTTKGENVYTDSFRDGFRSKQKNDVNFVHSYQGLSTVFQGIEAKNEIDRFLDDDNRKVGLEVEGLDGLLL